jgi:LAO/AO transport system kinase
MSRVATTDDVEELAAGVRAGDRASVARAITVVESNRADHQDRAQELLRELMPFAGNAHRVGITGPPGVGKSTFIDTLGSNLTASSHRVAVLAVDPSSARSGGSILGDKTRMARLAVDPGAFVRPSPSAGTLGGVAKATRESMLVMEAAGYDVVLVETVGVGQSEFVVADMVDTFLLLTLARTGDQLQGIKRGILEIVDVVAVNKADGADEPVAQRAARELAAALRLLRDNDDRPAVLACSGLANTGLDDVWGAITAHHSRLAATGELSAKRQRQLVSWTRAIVRARFLARLESPGVRDIVARTEAAVLAGDMTPEQAAGEIISATDLATREAPAMDEAQPAAERPPSPA